MSHDMPMGGTPAGAPLVLVWLAMMLVMMLPAAVPFAQAYGATLASRTGRARARGIAALLCGYLGLWLLFALALAAAQAALTVFELFTSEGQLSSRVASGVLLLAAGLYQLTPWKQAFLERCRSPLTFLAVHWSAGMRGALRMGAMHGMYCIGCCWLLFAALFALGTMSLAWMAVLVAVLLAERRPVLGPWVTFGAGFAASAYGLSLFY